jgi:hypothetical protein
VCAVPGPETPDISSDLAHPAEVDGGMLEGVQHVQDLHAKLVPRLARELVGDDARDGTRVRGVDDGFAGCDRPHGCPSHSGK